VEHYAAVVEEIFRVDRNDAGLSEIARASIPPLVAAVQKLRAWQLAVLTREPNATLSVGFAASVDAVRAALGTVSGASEPAALTVAARAQPLLAIRAKGDARAFLEALRPELESSVEASELRLIGAVVELASAQDEKDVRAVARDLLIPIRDRERLRHGPEV
jgi:hypothetical protein